MPLGNIDNKIFKLPYFNMNTYSSSNNGSNPRLRNLFAANQDDDSILQFKRQREFISNIDDDLVSGGKNTQIYNYLKARQIRSNQKKQKQLRIDRVLITLIVCVNVFILFNQNQFSQIIKAQTAQLHELMTVNYDDNINQPNVNSNQIISQNSDKSAQTTMLKPARTEKTNNRNAFGNALKENPLSFLNTQSSNQKKQTTMKLKKNQYCVQKHIENPTLWQASLGEVEDIINN
jgi:hypothetical protein